MIGDWSKLKTLTTTAGNLTLNSATGRRYLALNENCQGGAPVRFNSDNMPQSDGALIYRQYLGGYAMRLAFALWDGDEPACGQVGQEMLDEIGEHIDALRNPAGTSRIIWQPENMANRMLNEIRLSDTRVVTVTPTDTEALIAVQFAVMSTFPYEMSESEGTPATLADGVPDTIDNVGNTSFWPVLRVDGPYSEFTIENLTTGDALVWDGPFIGTSEYVELDFFRGTAYLNGDEDNEIAGIDFLATNWWPLVPGGNYIQIDGASCDILWNSAWI